DTEADFFALGGHSLLARGLAGAVTRTFCPHVTPRAIMVGSTVSKLSAVVGSSLSAPPAPRLGV
ncbi:phosphopantetheine-binding protein, partial [Enterobacter sichuanensis]